MFDSVRATYQNFSASVGNVQQDLLEIRDFFVSIKNIVVGIFGFMGQQTAVLVFCTLLFLFVLNLIPFLFFDKKIRYYTGIGFGLFLAFFFQYTALAAAKFVFIMLLPVCFEYMIAFLFRKAGRFVGARIKKLSALFHKKIRPEIPAEKQEKGNKQ